MLKIKSQSIDSQAVAIMQVFDLFFSKKFAVPLQCSWEEPEHYPRLQSDF